MIDQLTVDKHWKRLFCSLMRLSLSLCKKMESTVHPELAAALARLLLLETANSDSPLPNSPFASQLQDQIYHIKHSQAREIATNAIAIYEERGG